MRPNDAPLADIGTVARPFFLGGRIALRRDGIWLVQATRLVARQRGTADGPGEEQPWSPSAGQTPEFAWARDESAFIPVADPVEAADLDARAAFRRTLGAWPW